MLVRRLLLLSIAAAMLAASGCERGSARGRALRITSVAGAGAPLAGAGVVSTNGAGVVSTNGAGIVSTNGAALTGVVRGPSAAVVANHAAGVLANNAAGLLGNNAGSLVANNAAGLVGNHTAGYRAARPYALAHASDRPHAARLAASSLLVPLPGALVEAFDLAGTRISQEPARTGPDGAFSFPAGALGPSTGALIFRATLTVGARTLTLEALVPRGAALTGEAIALSPASTLVAKKAGTLAAQGPLTLGAEAAEALSAALAPFLTERAAVAGVLLAPTLAGQVFDAMTGASPGLATALGDAGEATGGDALLAGTPAATGAGSPAGKPAPGPTPRRTGSGGSGGGGSTPLVVAPQAATAASVTSDDRWLASRIAGTGTHGSAPGTDPLSATVGELGGVAVAPDGSVYFTDVDHHQIRRLNGNGPVELVAGQADEAPGDAGDGQPARAARFNFPLGLAFDDTHDVLVVADHDNNRIRAFAPGGRIATMVGGGGDGGETVASPLQAQLDGPAGLALDPNGWLFFTEHWRVRRLAPSGELTTLAGLADGNRHWPIAVDPARQLVWYGDGAEVKAITGARGAAAAQATPVFTAAGAGPDAPRIAGLATDRRGRLYVLQVAEEGGQPRDVRLFRILTGVDGLALGAPEAIAGTGALANDEAGYVLPGTGTLNALGQLLPGIGGCGLAIDLGRAASPSSLAGQLYFGGSAEFAGETAGQLIRFDPSDTGALPP